MNAQIAFINAARRHLRIITNGIDHRDPCPRPSLTQPQARRVQMHSLRTGYRRDDPRRLTSFAEPYFDADPSQRCREV